MSLRRHDDRTVHDSARGTPNTRSRSTDPRRVRAGTGVPLVLCNGIGASLEVLDPLVEHLNPDTTVVRFDVPGAGSSPDSPLPYGFPYLAAALRRLLDKLELQERVDVLGLSWGRRAGTAVRRPQPPPLPAADPGSHRHGHRDGAGQADRARENAHSTAIPGSRLRRVNRRRPLRRDGAYRCISRQVAFRASADGRFAGGLFAPTSRRIGLDEPLRAAARPRNDRSLCSSVPKSVSTSMFPVSGALQLHASGASCGLRPMISASGAYSRFDNPGPHWGCG